jgi:hypothetical protein
MGKKSPLCKDIVRDNVAFQNVNYNGLVEASMQGCSKGSKGPSITVHVMAK